MLVCKKYKKLTNKHTQFKPSLQPEYGGYPNRVRSKLQRIKNKWAEIGEIEYSQSSDVLIDSGSITKSWERKLDDKSGEKLIVK